MTLLLSLQLSFASATPRAVNQLARPAVNNSLQQVLRAEPAVLSATHRGTSRSLVMTKAEGEPQSFTQVPKAKTDEEAVTGALALAHDCQAAYGEGAAKASDPELKQALEKFASQAAGQIDQLRGLLNPPPDKETGISSALNAGKVKFAQIAGDKAIVKAIYNNSNDSFTAYNEVSKRDDFSSKTTSVAKKLAPEAKAQRDFFDKWQAAQ